MQIRLEHLIPLPMKELDTSGSEIWEAEQFIFEKGKKYLVEAPSGKGKTSLLALLYGIRKDYSGSFFLDDAEGRSISSREWSRLRKNRLSFIFQGLELFDDLAAIDNIALKNSITAHKSNEEILVMAERLGIAPFLHRNCGVLSYGQRQRVAIIRALCQPFSFLFADECFSHIDRANSASAFQLITEECERNGAGLILASLENAIEGIDHHLKL